MFCFGDGTTWLRCERSRELDKGICVCWCCKIGVKVRIACGGRVEV